MKSDVEVSVLVTFYNQEKCVDVALQSIMNQVVTFDYEVLVGDDGSSDNTRARIDGWVEKYPSIIKCFSWPRNQKIKYEAVLRASNNRLGLLAEAKGKYVVFLDGDDYFTDNSKLQLQYNALQNNPECGSCCHNFSYVDIADSNTVISNCSLRDGIVQFHDYWRNEYIHAECFMFRTPSSEAFLNIKKWKNFDDCNIVYFLARENPIIYLNRSMVNYVQEETGSWLGRPVDDRNIISLVDYFLELEVDSSFEQVSTYRHSSELIWLLRGGYLKLKSHIAYKKLLTYSQFRVFEKKYLKDSILGRIHRVVLLFEIYLKVLFGKL